jgi:phosphoglycolate phosphatase
MIKLIIFDYDGVIVDSFPNVYEVYKIICDRLGKQYPERIEDFRKIYGNTSSECYENLGFSEEEKIRANLIFKEEILKKEPTVFEGIADVLELLHKKHKLALLSSTYRNEVEQKLKKFGLLPFFDFIVARENHHTERFSKAEPIKKIISDLALEPEEVLLIGDRNIDFIEGSAAGLKNILLVDYGWGYDRKEIPNYRQKILIEKPKDLLKAIESFS